jgi:hypothetical protein
MYIINNQYVIGGSESEENNSGYYLCRLSPCVIEVCKDLFDSNKIYYISNIKNAKDKLNDYLSEVKNKSEIEDINKRIQDMLDCINKTETWKSFNFSENDITNLFENNISMNLFQDNKKIPEITISKSLFPLVTEKNVSDLYYNITTDKEYNELIVSLDFPLFQLYMVYKYIDIN